MAAPKGTATPAAPADAPADTDTDGTAVGTDTGTDTDTATPAPAAFAVAFDGPAYTGTITRFALAKDGTKASKDRPATIYGKDLIKYATDADRAAGTGGMAQDSGKVVISIEAYEAWLAGIKERAAVVGISPAQYAQAVFASGRIVLPKVERDTDTDTGPVDESAAFVAAFGKVADAPAVTPEQAAALAAMLA